MGDRGRSPLSCFGPVGAPTVVAVIRSAVHALKVFEPEPLATLLAGDWESVAVPPVIPGNPQGVEPAEADAPVAQSPLTAF